MKVFLTGGSNGIGATVCEELIRYGAEVTVMDLCEPDQPVERWIEADLTDTSSAASLAANVPGPFHVLINSAGLPPRPGEEVSILTVNYFSLVAVTEAVLPNLSAGSSIINVASKAGSRWRENIAQVRNLMLSSGIDSLAGFIADLQIDAIRAYDLSKEAVIAWSMANVERLIQRSIRINCVSPAAVSTRILPDFETAFGDRAAKMIKRVGRPGTPQEVAYVIRFLATRESRWINGADIPVDGGTAALIDSDTFGLSSK